MINLNTEASIQINNGLKETSADGAGLVFDKKYGIMFCAYMPGMQGKYGESRGRISLSYFPASQPTNIKFIEVAVGDNVYCHNITHIGDGKVRVIYERNSKADCDHFTCYKDFDFLSEALSEEKILMLNKDDGTTVPLTESEQFSYLEKHGFSNHTYLCSEQIAFGGHTIFRGEDGWLYGAITSYLSEVILYRSKDNLASLEFFAIYPKPAQYEFDYKYFNGKIYAIYRTNKDEDAIALTTSEDNGKSWSEPYFLKHSIQCRPRIIIHNGRVLVGYNIFNEDTKNRPAIQQGRSSITLSFFDDAMKETKKNILHSKYGMVNMSLCDILGDAYIAFSSSVLALEYHNGNPLVRGKDAVRYMKIGNLSE